MSGTVSRAPWAAQGVFQAELRNRLRHPLLRTLRPASLDGIADILNFFPALRVVKPLPVIVGREHRPRESHGQRFSDRGLFSAAMPPGAFCVNNLNRAADSSIEPVEPCRAI